MPIACTFHNWVRKLLWFPYWNSMTFFQNLKQISPLRGIIWYPCFWLLVISALGFKPRVDPFAFTLCRLHTMYFSDWPLVARIVTMPFSLSYFFKLGWKSSSCHCVWQTGPVTNWAIGSWLKYSFKLTEILYWGLRIADVHGVLFEWH